MGIYTIRPLATWTGPVTEPQHAASRRARRNTHPDRNGGDHRAWHQVEQAMATLGLV